MFDADEKKEAKGVSIRELVSKVHDGSKKDEDKIKVSRDKVEACYKAEVEKEKKK